MLVQPTFCAEKNKQTARTESPKEMLISSSNNKEFPKRTQKTNHENCCKMCDDGLVFVGK